ncbi:hypothetical protein BK138_16095 [Paenibacillus rhizosphaerae]|uniref:Copper amine oxidase-like N-terminal domain-containing protein n=1 Tax=Paenibacillus rhizosphaerae TaxID=297318 RepID=A0A1R1ESB9_9BACL|nr:stalk domain-containing protein [Paenibacillus rhizosphaerae]OMF54678.1 hypothetical protein BK138_16095 [Paenibacillus rhizosphaerae]
MRKKLFVTLGACMVFAIGGSAGVYAGSNLQAIKAYFDHSIKFEIQGKAWNPVDSNGKATAAITYNNTTYLPVKSIGEALGVGVSWDAPNHKVVIGGGSSSSTQAPPTQTQTPPTTPSTATATKSNPAKLNQTVNFTTKSALNTFEGTVSIDEILRGDAAWKQIEQANMFNDPAPDGYEYILAKASIKITKNSKPDTAVDVTDYLLSLISSDGREYDRELVVAPEPTFRSKLYEGASNTGWVVLTVKKTDTAPLIAFGRNYDGTGGVWFSTK